MALGALLAVILGLVTQPLALQDELRMAQGGQVLRQALSTRAQLGDLPFGPGTPGVWSLGRAGRSQTPAPGGPDGDALAEADGSLFRQAVADLEQVGEANPARWARAQRLLGIGLAALGDYPQATQALDAAHRAQPRDPFAALALGNTLDAQGQREAAMAVWLPTGAQQAISLQLYRQGAALANAQEAGAGRAQAKPAGDSAARRAEALQMLLQAAEIDPTNADALHALGGFYWGEDQQKAVDYYRAALATGGLRPFFQLIAQGRVAMFEGRIEDAASALMEAVRLQPNHLEANQMLGVALGRLGRTGEAFTYLDRAASLSPNAFWPLLEKAQIYLNLGDNQQALDALQQAVARRNDQPYTFELMAQAYVGAGQTEQAAEAWQRAIELNPGNARYYVRLGDLWQQAGRMDRAIAAYREALKLDPANSRAGQELKRLGG